MRLLFGEIRYAALFFALAFVPAQTLNWPRAWILIGVAFVVRTIGGLSVIRVNPDLLEERSKVPIHSGQPTLDKILLPAVMGSFACVIALCSIDRFHWRLFPEPNIVLCVHGIDSGDVRPEPLAWLLGRLDFLPGSDCHPDGSNHRRGKSPQILASRLR